MRYGYQTESSSGVQWGWLKAQPPSTRSILCSQATANGEEFGEFSSSRWGPFEVWRLLGGVYAESNGFDFGLGSSCCPYNGNSWVEARSVYRRNPRVINSEHFDGLLGYPWPVGHARAIASETCPTISYIVDKFNSYCHRGFRCIQPFAKRDKRKMVSLPSFWIHRDMSPYEWGIGDNREDVVIQDAENKKSVWVLPSLTSHNPSKAPRLVPFS